MVIVGDIASSDQSIESGDGNDGADVKSLLNGERRRRRRRDAPAVTRAEEKEIVEEEQLEECKNFENLAALQI